MYRGVFGAALAERPVRSMDQDKLDAIASGIVALPEINSLRVTDPANGHVFVNAFNRDGVVSISHRGQDDGEPIFATPNVPRNRPLRFRPHLPPSAPGSSVVGQHAEFVSGHGYLLHQIVGRTMLIVGAAVVKKPSLWGHLPDRWPALSAPPSGRAVARNPDTTTPEEPGTDRSQPVG